MRISLRALALCAAVLAAAPVARATSSRAVALGDLGQYIEDDTNVLRYPGLLGRYSHFVYVDLAGPSGLSPALTETQQGGLNGGAYIRLVDGLHLGVVASDFAPGEHAAFLNQVATLNGAPLEMADPALAGNRAVFSSLAGTGEGAFGGALRRYDVIFAYSQDKYFGAGLRLSYGSNSETFVPDKNMKTNETPEPGKRTTDYRSLSQFRAQAGISGDTGSVSYDVALDYNYYGLGYLKNEKEPFIGGGGHGFGANARARFVLSRYWDLIPQVSYKLSSFNLLEDSTVPAFGAEDASVTKRFENDASLLHTRTSHNLDVGAAAALRASKKATFWIATGMQLASTRAYFDADKIGPKFELDVATMMHSLPYIRLAVEGQPLDWLVLRAGLEKFSWRQSTEIYYNNKEPKLQGTVEQSGAVPTTGETGRADFATYVGASFLLQGFALDLLLDQEFFKRGPAFLSGAQGAIAGRATVSYKF